VYEETADSVYRYAFTLVRNETQAEDLAAEVYLRAWRNRSALRGENPLPWLMSIAHNAAMSQLRATREVADLSLVSEQEEEADEGERYSEAELTALHRAIRRLTPEQQQVVFLRFFEGLPHESVASRLGSNPNAVRAIQFRALGRLRKLLEAPSGI
jgi:RNA polymerase sigma-70 factor (ECF subfamily)